MAVGQLKIGFLYPAQASATSVMLKPAKFGASGWLNVMRSKVCCGSGTLWGHKAG